MNLINICGSGKESFMTKISIRFFNNREVRADWDESSSQWFFAAVDISAIFLILTGNLHAIFKVKRALLPGGNCCK